MTGKQTTHLFERPDFFDDAACAGSDPNKFFPVRGEDFRIVAAQLVCNTCVVKKVCQEYAIPKAELKGVWGGMSERQRSRIRNRKAI